MKPTRKDRNRALDDRITSKAIRTERHNRREKLEADEVHDAYEEFKEHELGDKEFFWNEQEVTELETDRKINCENSR